MSVKCIDVSYAQGTIDFQRVRDAGVEAVILRAGYGNTAAQEDDSFAENYRGATAAGLKVGAYWYSYAGWGGQDPVTDAKAEAKACLSVLKGKTLELPVFYDLEESADPDIPSFGKTVCTEIARTFCDAVKKGGYRSGVYADLNWFENVLDYDALKKRYFIWLAQWSDAPSLACDIWQNSDRGRISGVSGTVDTDVIRSEKVISVVGEPVLSKGLPKAVYRVRCGGRWLPEVTDLSGYAGIVGEPITDVALRVTAGKVKYRVHLRGGHWLPFVSGCDIADFKNGYAGKGKAIDAVQIVYRAPKKKPYRVQYRVSPLKAGYYPWQYGAEKENGQDGYAGKAGKKLDRLQIVIRSLP